MKLILLRILLLVVSLGTLTSAPAQADPTPTPAKPLTIAEQCDIDLHTAILKIFPKIDPTGIDLKGGTGRAQIIPEINFSYLIETFFNDDGTYRTNLTPMSSSRDRAGYESSPDWFTANKDKIDAAKAAGQPMPHQDPKEFQKWLDDNGVSANPTVYYIDEQGKVTSESLVQNLFKYFSQFATQDSDGNYYVYRGAANDEADLWSAMKAVKKGDTYQGQEPKGRYWTLTAMYGLRYARKQPGYLRNLIKGTAPILKFRIPKKEFEWQVTKQYITAGYELPKAVHNTFDQYGYFVDELNDAAYVGMGRTTAENELLASRKSKEEMAEFYDGFVTIEDLITERVKIIGWAIDRLQLQYPHALATDLGSLQKAALLKRIERTKAEGVLLIAMRDKKPAADVQKLFDALPSTAAELTNDFNGDSIDAVVSDYVKGTL